VQRDGVTIFTGSADGSFNFDSFGLGNYSLTVTATDADNDRTGDSLTTTQTRTVTVTDDDTAAPTITLGGSSGTQTDGQNQNFTWNVTDASGLASVAVTITRNGSTVFTSTNASGVFDFNSLGLGDYA